MISDPKRRRSAAYRKGFERAQQLAIAAAKHRIRTNDCECLGPMDPTTGISECSIDLRGGNCLCNERFEEATEIAERIRKISIEDSP